MVRIKVLFLGGVGNVTQDMCRGGSLGSAEMRHNFQKMKEQQGAPESQGFPQPEFLGGAERRSINLEKVPEIATIVLEVPANHKSQNHPY